MAFRPRLPTFHYNVGVRAYNPDTGSYGPSQDLTGQIYTQQRTQDDASGGTLYLMYPKEDDVLRDLADYDNSGESDVVLVPFPAHAPRVIPYRVRDVQPRWLGFPNEHLMATLTRLTPSVYSSLPGVTPPQMPLSGFAMQNGACESCVATFSGTFSLDLVDNTPTFKRWVTTAATTCYPPGTNVILTVQYFPLTGFLASNVTANGATFQQWDRVEPNWDLHSEQTLPETFGGDGQCGWPATILVGPAV